MLRLWKYFLGVGLHTSKNIDLITVGNYVYVQTMLKSDLGLTCPNLDPIYDSQIKEINLRKKKSFNNYNLHN